MLPPTSRTTLADWGIAQINKVLELPHEEINPINVLNKVFDMTEQKWKDYSQIQHKPVLSFDTWEIQW